MGSLVTEIPHSEVTATLELLNQWGITREDLTSIRAIGSGPTGMEMSAQIQTKITWFKNMKGSPGREVKVFQGAVPIHEFVGPGFELKERHFDREINRLTMMFVETRPLFLPSEDELTGEEIRARAISRGMELLDVRAFYSFWLNYTQCTATGAPGESDLEWARVNLGWYFVRFPNEVFVDSSGSRHSLVLWYDELDHKWNHRLWPLANKISRRIYPSPSVRVQRKWQT